LEKVDMKQTLKQLALACSVLMVGTGAMAKLPALSDEAKAKAAEAGAKTAWAGKVDGYKLCKSQDQAAAHYYKTSKSAGKETKPAASLPPCADPGPFVYAPAAAAAPVVAGAAPAAAPAASPPAAVAQPAKKS
jgi:hypothetical protein